MTITYQAPSPVHATLQETLDANGEITTALVAARELAVQLTGSATTVDLRVQRHPATADGDLLDGAGAAPSAGSPQWVDVGAAIVAIPTVVRFAEPGVGFWRVKGQTITGGDVVVAISTSR